MKLIRRIVLITVMLSAGLTGPALAQPPIEQQGEFVPAGDLPQREQIPAAPLLIAAYAFVMVALFAYVVSVARRISAVKADIARLEAELKRGSRA